MNPGSDPRGPRGQVLVIVALGLVVVLAMVGLVVDGGYAWGRSRDTQNGADALAKTGTTVIQHYLAGVDAVTPTDWSVACAIDAAATQNGVKLEEAEYTDWQGQSLVPQAFVGPCGAVDPGTPIPTGAQGINARTSETFDTFIMKIVGISDLTTVADATAVVGTPTSVPGGALPVTFPQKGQVFCDTPATAFEVRRDDKDGAWEPYEIIDEANANASNLAIIPLCDVAPGSVGWLDFDCGQNLKESIVNPCQISIPIPAWLHTQTGDVNALEKELNAYTGSQVGVAEAADSVLAVPIHDFTCESQQADSAPITACPGYPTWSGNGDNLYYHIPFWVGFKLDKAYVLGGDPECGQSPGSPVLVDPQPKGKIGCLKGWFVNEFDQPGPIGLAHINPGENVAMQVALIE